MKKLLVVITLVFTLLACLPLAVCAETEAVTDAVTESVTEVVTEATTDDVDEITTDDVDETTPLATETTGVPAGDTSAETDDGPKTNFGFYPDSLKETLPVMGMGMLGIFVVIGLIVLTVLILRWVSGKLDKGEED